MLKAVIFDFGNVIGFFDHQKTFARIAPYTSWPPQRIYAEIYAGQLEDDLESGRIGVDEFLDHFVGQCGLTCDRAFLHNAIGDIFTPNPAICDLIPKLKGRCRIVLGSNTNPLHTEKFQVQFADVLSHFDDQVLSYAIGARKPRPEFFEECVRRAKCAADECLFIDDLPANIAGAEAAGLRGWVYHPGVNVAEELRRNGITIDGA